MKKYFCYGVLLVSFSYFMIACGSSASLSSGGGSSRAKSSEGAGGGGSARPGSKAQSGTLTAGSFDDHLNFPAFQKFLKKTLKEEKGLEAFQPREATPMTDGRDGSKGTLDLSFVIDTTGSMGDELNFIKKELADIVSKIRSKHPKLKIRFSLIVYRDKSDEYVVSSIPFTTSLSSFQKTLGGQKARGGGDYPEAMHRGLEEAVKLKWSSENAVRVLFLLADAPPHDQDGQATLDAVNKLKKQGVKIFPVGASGVGVKAEYFMRISAFITNGIYLFLTDDSGVGNSHKEPSIPCYHVEKLNELMIRVISSEVVGLRTYPKKSEIIRSVGKPMNGVCQ